MWLSCKYHKFEFKCKSNTHIEKCDGLVTEKVSKQVLVVWDKNVLIFKKVFIFWTFPSAKVWQILCSGNMKQEAKISHVTVSVKKKINY